MPIIFFALACLAVLIFNLCARRPQAGISGISWLMDRADAHPMRDVGSGLPAWTAAFTSNLTHNCLQGQCPPWAQRSSTSHNMKDSPVLVSAEAIFVYWLAVLCGSPLGRSLSWMVARWSLWLQALVTHRFGVLGALARPQRGLLGARPQSPNIRRRFLIAPSLRQSVWATSLL